MQIQKIDNSQSLKPMFKGQLGDKLIRNYTQGGELTSNVVIKEIKGFCGISKSKLVDVLDSFIAKLRNNSVLLKTLDNKVRLLQKECDKRSSEIQLLEAQVENRDEHINSLHCQLDAKDATIERLEKELDVLKQIRPLLKIKSVDEIDLVTPEIVNATLIDIKAHDMAAMQSILDFAFSGVGEEEFLKQIERNNIIQKAKLEKLDEIPEVKEMLVKFSDQWLGGLGLDSALVAESFIENSLKCNTKGAYLASPKIFEQVKNNLEALLSTLRDNKYPSAYQNIDVILKSVVEFHKLIAENKEKLEREHGMTFSYIENPTEPLTTSPKYVFSKRNENLYKISFAHLSTGFYGYAEEFTPDGKKLKFSSIH